MCVPEKISGDTFPHHKQALEKTVDVSKIDAITTIC
jgi:hypothetical protein